MPKESGFLFFLKELRSGLFPTKIFLKEKDSQLLRLMYPTINWQEVEFYVGLPWYIRFSFAYATALPHSFRRNKTCIFIKNYDAENPNDLATMVHEAYHILQYQELRKRNSFGIGFFQNFMWHYLGWFIAMYFQILFKKNKENQKLSAYFDHPLEKPAYSLEWDFSERFRDFSAQKQEGVVTFFQLNPSFIVSESKYSGGPGFLPFFVSVILSLIIFLVKPIIEIFIFVLTLPLIFFQKKYLCL